MSQPVYSVLRLFTSSPVFGYLAEISRTVPNKPEAEVREWVWIEAHRATTLQPLAGSTLAFEEGCLHLEGHRGELRWTHGRSNALQLLDSDTLPAFGRRLLEIHLT